ncbi:MAG: hypothetical protein ROO76_07205 [Terriglobia bacterium]|nr:hypothetical protein [Terriglobia bacterium]
MPKTQQATAMDLKEQIANFKKWLESHGGDSGEWQEGRKERLAWYREHLTQPRIEKLTEAEFATLIKSLWAVNIWHNKDYKVEKLISDNGLDKIRVALKDLLFGASPIQDRWDAFRGKIKGLGPSSLSEILTFFDPQQYSLVNLKPYEVLPRIGYSLDSVSDGKSYQQATDEIGKVKTLLVENGLKDADFLIADFFIAYLFYQVFHLEGKRSTEPVVAPAPKASETPESNSDNISIASHESAEAILLMLGNLLGYDTYTPDASRTYDGQKLGQIATLDDLPAFSSEKVMDSVRNIDVVWLKDEWPEYFFEVEHTTGVTSGLLRIYQAHKLSTKFFIIGPADVLKKYEKEVQKSPFASIQHKYRFRSYDELRQMYLLTSRYRKMSDEFLG